MLKSFKDALKSGGSVATMSFVHIKSNKRLASPNATGDELVEAGWHRVRPEYKGTARTIPNLPGAVRLVVKSAIGNPNVHFMEDDHVFVKYFDKDGNEM